MSGFFLGKRGDSQTVAQSSCVPYAGEVQVRLRQRAQLEPAAAEVVEHPKIGWAVKVVIAPTVDEAERIARPAFDTWLKVGLKGLSVLVTSWTQAAKRD